MLEHLSDKLQNLYPGRPKEGEFRSYKLAKIRKGRPKADGGRAYVIPTSKSLPSSYPILDNGEKKNISYIERILPTEDPTKVKQELGWVEFRETDGGIISISHENYPETMNIDKFLFFSPFLIGANKESYYIKHIWGMFIAKDSPEKSAEEYLNIDQLKHKAKGLVFNMDKQMLGILIDQLKLGHSARISEKEMTQKLSIYCESTINGDKAGGAKSIITVSSDKEIVLKKLIQGAIKIGRIKASINETEMIWAQGGAIICPKLPGKSLIDSMIMFFATSDGREVLGALKQAVSVVVDEKTLSEDKYGPLKGSPEWDKLSISKRGDLNKLRKAENKEQVPVVT